ncbi:hypothetical protein [Methylobacterium sp. Leaf361]|uniref:hypothetical protein n=1 Tax=Methylobacterium sp. Leaf361 TaxID=1736352 RepID=UPI0012FEE95B|nr:hypothetical protein [Methylobacterium sp. Leaf361]
MLRPSGIPVGTLGASAVTAGAYHLIELPIKLYPDGVYPYLGLCHQTAMLLESASWSFLVFGIVHILWHVIPSIARVMIYTGVAIEQSHHNINRKLHYATIKIRENMANKISPKEGNRHKDG